MVSINKIKADRSMANRRFTGARRWQIDRFPRQNLGTAGLVNSDRLGHNRSLIFW
jgi:hypothetical protein